MNDFAIHSRVMARISCRIYPVAPRMTRRAVAEGLEICYVQSFVLNCCIISSIQVSSRLMVPILSVVMEHGSMLHRASAAVSHHNCSIVNVIVTVHHHQWQP